MRAGRQVLKSTSVVSFFTGVSRVLGLVREMLMAHLFGTTVWRSAFAIAFAIPNLFRAVLGEGALNAAFVPLITATREEDGEEKAARLASSIFSLVGALLLLIVGVGLIVLVVLSKQDLGAKWNAVVSLSIITLPYVLFICLAALCMGVFHCKGKFAIPSASQGLLNVVWIIVMAVMLVTPSFGSGPAERIYFVAWAIIVAGAVQLTFQSIFLRRGGFDPAFALNWAAPGVKKFLALMAPVLLGSGVTQLNVLLSRFLAMAAGDWAPAALNYADRLIYLPLGLFATALGTVLLPTFTRQAVAEQKGELVALLNASIRNICLIMMPVAAAAFALALPVVNLLFRSGEFDEVSAGLTARALMAYAPGLIVFSIYKMVVPAFHAMRDTKTPVKVAAGATGISLILNILSVLYLPDGYQHVGLAGSVVISMLLACAVLLLILGRRLGGLHLKKTLWSISSTCISGMIMAAICIKIYSGVQGASWFIDNAAGKLYQAAAILIASGGGLVVYAAARYFVNPRETADVVKAVFSRNRRSNQS